MIGNRLLRYLVLSVGLVSLALGIVGIFLPLLPTTPFVLLAVGCFMRSSPWMHDRIRQNPHLGPILKNWEERKAISRSAKIQAVTMIVVSVTIMWLKIEPLTIRVGVTAFLVAVTIFIVSRPE